MLPLYTYTSKNKFTNLSLERCKLEFLIGVKRHDYMFKMDVFISNKTKFFMRVSISVILSTTWYSVKVLLEICTSLEIITNYISITAHLMILNTYNVITTLIC